MAFNISSYPINETDITGFFIWANVEVNGLIGIGFLVVFFVSMFFVMKTFETKKAFAGSAFVTAIIGVMLWALGLISTRYAVISVLVAATSLLWLIWEKD